MGKRIRDQVKATSLLPRHLRWESFEARINRGPPSVEPVAGSPVVHLFIEALGRRVGARFFSKRVENIPSPLAEVMIRSIGIGARTALEVSTSNTALYRDFYTLCCTIADRIQLEGQSVTVAVTKTLAAWAALIRAKSLLSQERQIGLIGELLFLDRIAKKLGWEVAAASWLGPNSEEHDFVLPTVDVEVKCTTREQRIHRITSLTQLLPKAKRRLQFVSIQITAAGDNQDAFSLPTMIASVLGSAAQVSVKAVDLIRDQIQQQGWQDEDAPSYDNRYHLRSPMMTVEVSSRFPAITPKALAFLGGDAAARIDRVSYLLDVDGLGIVDGSSTFEKALFGNRKPK